MNSEREYFPQKTSTYYRGQRTAIRLAAITTVLTLSGNSAIFEHDKLQEHSPKVVDADPVSCSTAPSEAVITKVILTPLSEPQIKNQIDTLDWYRGYNLGELLEESSFYFDKAFAAAQEVAQDGNLSLVDKEMFEFAREAIYSASSVDEVKTSLSAYMSKYGVKLWIDPAIPTFEDGKTIEEKPHFHLRELKHSTWHFISSMVLLPKDLVKLAEIDSIKIVDSEQFEGDYAWYDSGDRSIYYSVKAFLDSDSTTLYHEVGHALDFSMCGEKEAWDDEVFLNLNPTDFEYLNEDALTSDGIEHVVDPHGAKNVVEDKATLFEHLLNGIDHNLIKTADDVIRKKYILLAIRLEERLPGIISYLQAIS